MEIKEIKEAISTGVDGLKKDFEELRSNDQKAFDEKIEAVKKSLEGLSSKEEIAKSIESTKEQMQKQFDELATKFNENKEHGKTNKSFRDLLGEALDENAKSVIDLASAGKGKLDYSLNLKAPGDMSYAANFTEDAAAGLTTEYRQNVLPLPSEQIWMRNIIPGGTTSKGSIFYPRYTGGEGEVDIWDETASPRTTKPLIDFDFDAVNQKLHWLAGIVRIPREMLEDIPYLRSFLQTQLLIGPQGLYAAENNYMLNHTDDGLIPNADAYDGTDYDVAVDRIIDAAWGQVVESHFQPNVVILHPRDAVAIALNKAEGSGEYDLPNGSVGFINGRLTIAGLQVVATTEVARGEFLVGDRRTAQFITRTSPEVRFFEQDVDNVQKNMITVRVEERAALLIYYPEAWVTGTLNGTT